MRKVSKVVTAMFQVTALASLMATIHGCGTQSSDDNVSEVSSSGGSSSCPSNVQWQSFSLPQNNRLIYDFARSKMGVQVGGGECAHLASEGLKKHGLKNFSSLGPTGPDADYVWGDRVKTIQSGGNAKNVMPGDIIQYRNFKQKVTSANGSWWSSSAAHHTSVVRSVSVDGKHVCVYHQNSGGNRTVSTGYLNLPGMNSGTLWVYRPRR